MSIVEKIQCSHCGAPIAFEPGELIATCKYCGFTVVIETGEAFTFEHSMLLNKYDVAQIEEPVKYWMRTGFLKPPDLAKKAEIRDKALVYLPFWIVTVEVNSTYKGVFERITPAVVKEGKMEKEYDWLVLARKVTVFPTREYNVPLEGKIPYDFRKIENFAKILNSEIDKSEAVELAEQQIKDLHLYLIKEDVDKIVEVKSEVKLNQVVYLHVPIWFIKYEYRSNTYQLFVDGTTGSMIKGDIPSTRL